MTDSEEQNPASAPRNRDISSVTCAASARGEPREPEHSPASGDDGPNPSRRMRRRSSLDPGERTSRGRLQIRTRRAVPREPRRRPTRARRDRRVYRPGRRRNGQPARLRRRLQGRGRHRHRDRDRRARRRVRRCGPRVRRPRRHRPGGHRRVRRADRARHLRRRRRTGTRLGGTPVLRGAGIGRIPAPVVDALVDALDNEG